MEAHFFFLTHLQEKKGNLHTKMFVVGVCQM